MADGFLAPLSQPETGALASLLYPLRGAEALAMAAAMGAIFWGFTILVPEYCLTVWSDANALGVSSMGMLVILISAIPALLLLPILLFYTLQYLGRVLMTSAKGDTVPPRTPDRNFEGVFHGLSPWLAWLVLGGTVGVLPLALFFLLGGQGVPGRPLWTACLIMFGLLYAQVALMRSFFCDHPLAAAPPGVLWTLMRHGGSLFPALVRVSAILGLLGLALIPLLALRLSFFWLYLLVALGWWVQAMWTAEVAMRMLGLHYFHHKDSLKWQSQHPRWGVSWRL
jgi:hypothetical protein